MENQTLGQRRVKAEFNPAKNDLVDQLKNKSALLIDMLESMRNEEASRTYDKTPEALQELSGEKLRLISLAQTQIETACMYAVKACFTN